MSPAQVSACYGGELGVSQSTVYRWVDAGYGGMTNLELRRKVGYRKRSRSAPRKPTPHSQRRSHGAFEALDEGVRDSAWEMDTVEGCEADAACLLTLFHRPTGFQLALLLEAQTSGEVARALGLVRSALGGEAAVRRVFGAVLTDNRPRVRRRGRARRPPLRARRRDPPVLLRPASRRPEGRLREAMSSRT